MGDFERGKGQGFYPSSVKTLASDAGTPFLDGYVSQGRGQFRTGLLITTGMPTAGLPISLIIRDGPAGPVLFELILAGYATAVFPLEIPFELENGIYVTGAGVLAGTQVIRGTFIHEVSEPGVLPQAQPR